MTIVLQNIEYDLNNYHARMALRSHLMAMGFFEYPENKGLWAIFDKSYAEGEEVKNVVQSINLFDQMKSGRTLKA